MRKLSLFPGAAGIDPSISEVTFGDFETRLRDRYFGDFKRGWEATRANLPEPIQEAVKSNTALQFLCWWFVEHFDQTKQCNVRPIYLPTFSGKTAELPPYRRAIESIRRHGRTFKLDGEGIDESKLRRLSALSYRGGNAMKGPVFDVDAYVLLLLFDALIGEKMVRFIELAQAFGLRRENVRKRIERAREVLQRHTGKKRPKK